MQWRRKKDREEDLDRELRSDLELEAQEQEEKGLSPEEAKYAARSALGNTGLIKEEVRDVWGWGWCDCLKQDVVYALRAFGRAPGFTSVVILTLALGIGATTAVFSVVHAILIDPLPYPNQDRLVMIFEEFAAVAVVLAAIGLYAVLSQLIAQRTREFGVRMALGARKNDLLKLVLREGMVLTLVGLAAGLMITLSLAGFLRSLIYGLKTTDRWTLSAGSLLLLLVTLLAMYLPALRASRVDPKVALQYE
jgi:hypothetical protein